MKKNFKFGVIGAGFMATAIIKGVINSNVVKSTDIIVSDVSEFALNKIKELGVQTTTDNKFLVNSSEFVLFAVKPQSLNDVLKGLEGSSLEKAVSIMAGIKRERIKKSFPNAKIARCMPNTPCAIGSGAVGIDLSDFTLEQDIAFIKSLFTSFAKVIVLDEKKMNAVTGVSGSSPAYFYLFLQGVIEAGVQNGLTYKEAKTLATSTMIGAGKMVQTNNDKSLDELINAVCSKGGTTIEAIKVYKDNSLNEITKKAIDACVKRSIELENV